MSERGTGRVVIGPANMRDLSWVTAHLRRADLDEIAEVEPWRSAPALAAGLMLAAGSQGWISKLDGVPAGAFGIVELHAGVAAGWAFGTDDFKRCVPAITRFISGPMAEDLVGKGLRRVEVRAMQGHDIARMWLRRMGFRAETTLKRFGRTRDFTLWAITDDQWRARHVHHAQSTQAAAAARAAAALERGSAAG